MEAYSTSPRPPGEARCRKLGPLARHRTDTKSCLAVGSLECRLSRATQETRLPVIPKAPPQWALLEADALKTTPPQVSSGTVRSPSHEEVSCDPHQRRC